jgi:uncharacterized protein DUF4352
MGRDLPQTSPPEGWYPNPDGSDTFRHWNGQHWTDVAPEEPPGPWRSRSRVTLLLVIVAGLVVVGGLAISLARNNRGSSTATTPTPTGPTISVETTVTTTTVTLPVTPTGAGARDGPLEFRVLEMTRSKTVSDPTNNRYLTATAQGEYIVLTVAVNNVGTDTVNYFSQDQALIDTSGVRYGPSADADLYMNAADGNPMGAINPGESIRVRVAFDVPPGTPAAVLELHALPGSTGVGIGLA